MTRTRPDLPVPAHLEMLAERYEVMGPIGRGGMGHVYEGRCLRSGARVAIKVMHADLPGIDATVAKRFSREAKILRSLHHPNIVRCVDHGVGQNGLAYLVMEYAAGPTLKTMLRQSGVLGELRTLDVAVQVCAGLEQAHTHGIVHRDIKEANVIVDTAGGSLAVKIVDFGVGKRLASASESNLTKPGHFVGSYMHGSPEQVAGRKLDARSDIYSLGSLLFVMLTGRAPFPSGSLEEIFINRLSMPTPRFRDVNAAARVSERTEEAVRRCLARHPDQRWQSMTTLRMELEECRREAAFPGGAAPKAVVDQVVEPRPSFEPEDTVVDDPNEHPRTRVDSLERYAVTLVDARFREPGTRSERGAPPLRTATLDDTVAPAVDQEPRSLSLSPRARRPREAMSTAFLLRVVAVMLASAVVALGLVWLLLGPT